MEAQRMSFWGEFLMFAKLPKMDIFLMFMAHSNIRTETFWTFKTMCWLSDRFLDSLWLDGVRANTQDRFEHIDFELVRGLGCVCHTSVSPTTSADHPLHAKYSSSKQLYESLKAVSVTLLASRAVLEAQRMSFYVNFECSRNCQKSSFFLMFWPTRK